MKLLLRVQYLCAELLYLVFNGTLAAVQTLLFGGANPGNPDTILIFRGGYLGDTLCAIPAMRAIQNKFPSARRILMTNKTGDKLPFSKEVVESILPFDDYLIFEGGAAQGWKYFKSLRAEIRARKVDLLVYMGASNYSFIRLLRDMLFFKAAGCRKVCGFRVAIHTCFSRAQREFKRFDREPDRLIKLVAAVGATENPGWQIPQVAFDLAVNHERPLIAVHPSAKFSVKKWPMERFISVCGHLQKNYNAVLVIIGGKEMDGDAHILSESLRETPINLVGKTNYLEMAEVLRRCDFLLSNDSGPIHAAEAVGTPVVGMYSSRDFPNVWYPVGEDHEILRKDVDCQICYLNECPIMICIKGISVEEVCAACDRLLKKKGYARVSSSPE